MFRVPGSPVLILSKPELKGFDAFEGEVTYDSGTGYYTVKIVVGMKIHLPGATLDSGMLYYNGRVGNIQLVSVCAVSGYPGEVASSFVLTPAYYMANPFEVSTDADGVYFKIVSYNYILDNFLPASPLTGSNDLYMSLIYETTDANWYPNSGKPFPPSVYNAPLIGP